MQIKVIKNYDGINGQLVEVVERKTTRTGRKDGHRHIVSYKGERRVVFTLPSCYGEISGHCISI